MTREEIIRNLKYTMEKHKNDTVNTFDTNILVMCKDILEYLEQEPKTGHWVKGKCDQCGGHAPFWSMATTYYESEYCPKCGARMEVEQNG